ncbi:MAG: hypothetical protein J3Q66DRAFT_407907 [Benniella sp.]|nr:MAG: hypothetical protein J3Q66DRAFT_407907 [Benniella sp.]
MLDPLSMHILALCTPAFPVSILTNIHQAKIRYMEARSPISGTDDDLKGPQSGAARFFILQIKDTRHNQFWDLTSGVCTETATLHLGEVASVPMNLNGTPLLGISKDNPNRLWIRMAGFAHDSLLVGGSEDVFSAFRTRSQARFFKCFKAMRQWYAMLYVPILTGPSDNRTVWKWYYDENKFYDKVDLNPATAIVDQ